MAKRTPRGQQPDADAEVLSGGPTADGDPAEAERRAAAAAEGDDAETRQPAKRKVNVGGKDYEVDAGMADVIDGLFASVRSGFDEIKAALPKQPPARGREEPEGDPADPLADLETEIFRNPRGALEKYGQIVEERVTKKLTGAYAKDRAADAEKDFWRAFYDVNDDLDRRTDHALVNAVLDQQMGKFKDIKDPEELAKKLGEETRQAILGYSRRSKQSRRQQAEGADGSSVESRAADDDAPRGRGNPENVVSLAEELRERRRAKRNPSIKTGAA